jgi:DNA (cytosine-5)-methyltransferase 1
MGMGGHNVPIILTAHGIRKLTPSECFSLMGFRNFKLPSEMAQSQLYKQAGNSVVVPVITRIAREIGKVV